MHVAAAENDENQQGHLILIARTLVLCHPIITLTLQATLNDDGLCPACADVEEPSPTPILEIAHAP